MSYFALLPDRPYCTDRHGRLVIRGKQKAVEFPLIQHNRSTLKHWLMFDLDCPDSYFRPEERGLPVPTFTAINRANGHAHVAYQLAAPVSFYDSSRNKPIAFYEAVSRGFTARLGADQGYRGFISKNPLSAQWETVWQSAVPYELSRLNDYLEPADKRKRRKDEAPSAIGRNVTVFDGIREIAYHEVLKFKKEGKTEELFKDFLFNHAEAINHTFHPQRLGLAEIRCLARSVSKYVWKRFTLEKFSAIQAARSRIRWEGHTAVSSTQPWIAEGISRRTWYKRKAAATSI